MAFFKTDPSITIKRDLDAAIAARTKLITRLGDAKASVDTATASAQQLAINDASDADLDKAEGIKRAAQDRMATLTGSLDQSNATIAKLETDLAIAIEAKTRAATVAAIAKMKVEFDMRWNRVSVALAEAEPITKLVATTIPIPECVPLHTFSITAGGQVPEAISLISGRLMADHSAAVAAGTAPATLKQPEAPAPKVAPVAAPPTQIVFCMRSVKWKNADGHIQLAGKFSDAYLPPALAAKALKSGAVVMIDHPSRRSNKDMHGAHPDVATAFDLDADEVVGTQASSQFEPSDYGKQKVVQIKVAR